MTSLGTAEGLCTCDLSLVTARVLPALGGTTGHRSRRGPFSVSRQPRTRVPRASFIHRPTGLNQRLTLPTGNLKSGDAQSAPHTSPAKTAAVRRHMAPHCGTCRAPDNRGVPTAAQPSSTSCFPNLPLRCPDQVCRSTGGGRTGGRDCRVANRPARSSSSKRSVNAAEPCGVTQRYSAGRRQQTPGSWLK